MDKYHIYEEIGKGNFSQVFKGREKKKIEYVAIKRVDKGIMKTIVNEVQIMHKFDSPHVLKFHDWYETRNNLWLIVEYCTGGDLASLLKQDNHLPEESVRMFGLDLLSGMKYLHQLGVLHCDLRPENILIDEYGILKISDFRLAKKIPKSNEKFDVSLSQKAADDVVSAYLAPELLQNGSLVSFSSDFWSLGCILFQLRRGFLPYGEASTSTILQERIKSTDPIHQPMLYSSSTGGTMDKGGKKSSDIPRFTSELADLLQWILERSVLDRIDWSNICVHPFWGSAVVDMSSSQEMPAQPVFDAYVRELRGKEKDAFVANNGSSRQEQFENGELDDDDERDAESATAESRLPIPSLPTTAAAVVATKGLAGGTSIAGAGKTVSSEEKTTAEKVSHTVGMPAAAVPLTDRSEVPELKSLLLHPSDVMIRPIVDNKSIETIERIPVKPNTLPYHPLTGANSAVVTLEDASRMTQLQLEAYLTQVYKYLLKTAASSSSSNLKNTATTTTIPTYTQTQINDRCAILVHLLSLSSSVEVANIVLNTHFLSLLLKLIRQGGGSGSVRSSSSATAKSSGTQSLTTSRTLSVTCLAIMLRYATYIQPPSATSTPTTPTVVATKPRAASALSRGGNSSSSGNAGGGGGASRAATPPADDPDNMLGALVAVIKETASPTNKTSAQDIKLRRRAVAALGELLFYISSQEEGAATEGEPRWTLPTSTVAVFLKCLYDDADEVTSHYVAKTVENVLAQGGEEYKRRFLQPEVAARLLDFSQRNSNAAFQSTCAMALSHLFTLLMSSAPKSSVSAPVNESESQINAAKLIAKLLEKLDGGLLSIIETLKDGEMRLQQAYLNIINIVFASLSSRVGEQDNGTVSTSDVVFRQIRRFFAKSSQFLPLLMRIIEQGGSVSVRGKALLCAQLICRYNPTLLATLSEKRFPQLLSRSLETSEGKDTAYVHTVSLSMLQFVRELALVSCGGISRSLKRLLAAGHHSSSTRPITSTLQKQSQVQGMTATPVKSSPGGGGGGGSVMYKQQTPESSSGRVRQTPPSAAGNTATPTATTGTTTTTTTTAIGSNNGAESPDAVMDTRNMLASIECMRAVVSISSLPSLRRRTVGGRDPTFLVLFAELLGLLPQTYSVFAWYVDSADHEEVEAAGLAVEQVALVAIEMLSQVDLELTQTATSDGSCSTAYLEAVMDKFVISLLRLSSYPRGEVRVVAASALRRLLPNACRNIEELLSAKMRHAGGVDLLARQSACVSAVLAHMRNMLADFAPIPQYTLRMLMDLVNVSPRVEALVAAELLRADGGRGLEVLLRLLRGAPVATPRSMQPEEPLIRKSNDSQPLDERVDPQVALLLHIIFKSTAAVKPEAGAEIGAVSPATVLMTRGLAGAVDVAFRREVQLFQNSYASYSSPSSSTNMSGLMSVLHLLLDCFEFTTASTSSSIRDHAAELEGSNSTIYALLAMCLRYKGRGNSSSNSAADSDDESTELAQLQCLGCICLGLHLRLFVETGFRTFLNSSSQHTSPTKKQSGNGLTHSHPAHILTEIISDLSDENDQVCGAAVKFLSQIVKLVANMNSTSKLRMAVADIISKPSLMDAIVALSKSNVLASSMPTKTFLREDCKILLQ